MGQQDRRECGTERRVGMYVIAVVARREHQALGPIEVTVRLEHERRGVEQQLAECRCVEIRERLRQPATLLCIGPLEQLVVVRRDPRRERQPHGETMHLRDRASGIAKPLAEQPRIAAGTELLLAVVGNLQPLARRQHVGEFRTRLLALDGFGDGTLHDVLDERAPGRQPRLHRQPRTGEQDQAPLPQVHEQLPGYGNLRRGRPAGHRAVAG